MRVDGKNLRKPQLVAKLRMMLEARRTAFMNSQRPATNAESEASLKRKLEEMEAEREATAKKYEELKSRWRESKRKVSQTVGRR